MPWIFPIIDNNIIKPKVTYDGDMTYLGDEEDVYGYKFSRFKLNPPLKFWHKGEELEATEGIKYAWKEK